MLIGAEFVGLALLFTGVIVGAIALFDRSCSPSCTNPATPGHLWARWERVGITYLRRECMACGYTQVRCEDVR